VGGTIVSSHPSAAAAVRTAASAGLAAACAALAAALAVTSPGKSRLCGLRCCQVGLSWLVAAAKADPRGRHACLLLRCCLLAEGGAGGG
jgi:hypothetical protein